MYLELSGSPHPLTPLENELRALAGTRGCGGCFIGHDLLPHVAELPYEVQWAPAMGVAG